MRQDCGESLRGELRDLCLERPIRGHQFGTKGRDARAAAAPATRDRHGYGLIEGGIQAAEQEPRAAIALFQCWCRIEYRAGLLYGFEQCDLARPEIIVLGEIDAEAN